MKQLFFNNCKFPVLGLVRLALPLALLAACFCLPASAQDVSVQVAPVPALAGEQAQLQIVSAEGSPELLEKPQIPGIKWLQGGSSRTETQIINMRTSVRHVSIYPFVPEKEGKTKFPALKVQVGNKKIATNPFELVVMSRKFSVRQPGGQKQGQEKQFKFEDIVFMKASPLTEKSEIYVGEEIPFEIRIYSLSGLKFGLGAWPEIQLENAVFRDYSRVNDKNSRFAPPTESSEKIDGNTFNVISIKTAFRIIAPGKVAGKVSVLALLEVPSQKRSRDPFDDFRLFSPFGENYDTVKQELTADIRQFTVKPLPPQEPGSTFLGLVGEWTIAPELSPDSENIKTGETLTLSLKIRGNGTTETLKAPDLKADGFRFYPPETDKDIEMPDGSTCTVIRYVMIPVDPGTASLDFNFSYFSAKEGKYVGAPLSRRFKIEKSKDVSSQQVVSDAGTAAAPEQKGAELPKRKSDLLHPKAAAGPPVELPIWKNHLAATFAFFALGILIPLLTEILLLWRERLVKDPLLRRRLEARRRKGAVMRELRAADAEGIHVAVQNLVLPYLNDLLGAPPGTSAGELSKRIEDKELSQCLCDAESSSYMPGAVSPSELKSRLIKALGRFSAVLISLAALCATALSDDQANMPPLPGSRNAASDPLACYYNGDFAAAAEMFRKSISQTNPSPGLLYNLGDCLYQTGDLPKALVCFERALRLSPRDSDIKENLNLIKRKLMLPETGRSETPAEAVMNIRDLMRPDEWLLASSLFFLLSGIFIAARRRFASRSWIGFASAAIFISLLCAAASFSQTQTSYSRDTAYIVERNISPHLLPSDNSNRASFKFNGGEEVRLVEERNGWLRVRAGNAEGWIKADCIEKLFP